LRPSLRYPLLTFTSLFCLCFCPPRWWFRPQTECRILFGLLLPAFCPSDSGPLQHFVLAFPGWALLSFFHHFRYRALRVWGLSAPPIYTCFEKPLFVAPPIRAGSPLLRLPLTSLSVFRGFEPPKQGRLAACPLPPILRIFLDFFSLSYSFFSGFAGLPVLSSPLRASRSRLSLSP